MARETTETWWTYYCDGLVLSPIAQYEPCQVDTDESLYANNELPFLRSTLGSLRSISPVSGVARVLGARGQNALMAPPPPPPGPRSFTPRVWPNPKTGGGGGGPFEFGQIRILGGGGEFGQIRLLPLAFTDTWIRARGGGSLAFGQVRGGPQDLGAGGK